MKTLRLIGVVGGLITGLYSLVNAGASLNPQGASTAPGYIDTRDTPLSVTIRVEDDFSGINVACLPAIGSNCPTDALWIPDGHQLDEDPSTGVIYTVQVPNNGITYYINAWDGSGEGPGPLFYTISNGSGNSGTLSIDGSLYDPATGTPIPNGTYGGDSLKVQVRATRSNSTEAYSVYLTHRTKGDIKAYTGITTDSFAPSEANAAVLGFGTNYAIMGEAYFDSNTGSTPDARTTFGDYRLVPYSISFSPAPSTGWVTEATVTLANPQPSNADILYQTVNNDPVSLAGSNIVCNTGSPYTGSPITMPPGTNYLVTCMKNASDIGDRRSFYTQSPYRVDNSGPEITNLSSNDGRSIWQSTPWHDVLWINKNTTISLDISDSQSGVSNVIWNFFELEPTYNWNDADTFRNSATPPSGNTSGFSANRLSIPNSSLNFAPDKKMLLGVWTQNGAQMVRGYPLIISGDQQDERRIFQVDKKDPQMCVEILIGGTPTYGRCSGAPSSLPAIPAAIQSPFTVQVTAEDPDMPNASNIQSFTASITPATAPQLQTQADAGYKKVKKTAAEATTNGDYTITVNASDVAGNVAPAFNVTFALDRPNYVATITDWSPLATDKVSLVWTAQQDPPGGWKIIDSNGNELGWFGPSARNTSSSHITFTGAPANHRQDLRVRACGDATCGTTQQFDSAAKTIYTLAKPPTNLAATAPSAESIKIDWSKNTNSNITPYQITLTRSGQPAQPLEKKACSGSVCTDTVSATPNTQYSVLVDAFNGEGVALTGKTDLKALPSPSAVQVCTPAKNPASPTPTGTPTSSSLSVRVGSNISDGNPASTTRMVQLCNDTACNSIKEEKAAPSAGGPVDFSNLQGGKTYYARTKVTSACGLPDLFSATPTPVATLFGQPGQVRVLENLATSNSFAVSVTAATGETPTCARVEYAGAETGSQIGPIGTIAINVGKANAAYTSIRASVGAGDCSVTGPSKNSENGDAYTKPAKSDGPTATTVGAGINVNINMNPANASGTQNYLKYWTGTNGQCGSRPASYSQTTPDGQTIKPFTVPPLSPGNLYCFQTVTVAARNSPSWDVESDGIGSAFTKFAPPNGAVTPLNTDLTLPQSNAFAIRIPRPVQGTLAPFAQVKYSGMTGAPIAVSMASFIGNSNSIDVAIPGVQPNRPFAQIQVRYVATDTAADTDPQNSDWNIASSLPAWTKPEAPARPSATQPNASRQTTITFIYPTANPNGTKYYLQVLERPLSGEPNWINAQEPVAPVVQGTNPPEFRDYALPGTAGTSYLVRIRAENLSPSPNRYPNLDSFSDAGEPGVIVYNTPLVAVDASDVTPDKIKVRITPEGDTPSVYIASYTCNSNTSLRNQIPQTFNPDGSAQILTVSVPVANSSYTVAGAVGDSDSRSRSSFRLASNNPAWTKPKAPPEAFLTVLPDLTKIQVTAINLEIGNSAGTRYQIQAVPDSAANFTNPNAIRATAIFRKGDPIPALENLDSNKTYYIRTYVFSDFISPTYDVWTDPIAVVTALPSAVGHFVASTSSTITAYWDTVVTEGVDEVLASIKDSRGTPLGNSKPLRPPFPAYPNRLDDILVENLQRSNTTYTLMLEKRAGGFMAPYPNSAISALTLAAVPPAPQETVKSGSVPNFSLLTVLAPDNRNAADSEYAIRITSNTMPPQYLDGAGRLTPFGQPPVWKQHSEWTGAAATLQNAGMAVEYKVALCVREKKTGKTVCSSEITRTMPGGVIKVEYPEVNGPFHDDFFFGVPLGQAFRIRFTAGMNVASLQSKISLTRRDNGPVPAITVVPVGNGRMVFDITPNTALEPVTAYRLQFEEGILDEDGFATKDSDYKDFFTGFITSQNTKIFSPHDTEGRQHIYVPQNRLDANKIVVPRLPMFNPPRALSLAPAVVDGILSVNRGIRVMSQGEIFFFERLADGFAPANLPAETPVDLVMAVSAPRASASALGAGAPAAAPDALKIFKVEPTGLVEMDTTDNGDGTYKASITQSGLYILAGAPNVNLSSAYAWPVPYKPSAGHSLIHFVNLAENSKVKVFTIMGELVKTLTDDDGDGTIDWDVKNEDGDRVASGVYIYQIKNAYSEKRGKLVIIR